MSLFLILVVSGLFGMALMALPAFNRHGPGVGGHAHAAGHIAPATATHAAIAASGHVAPGAGHLVHTPGAHAAPAHGTGSAHATGNAVAKGAGHAANSSLSRFIPSPRMIFSLMAAYGAFGYLLVDSLHLALPLAYGAAIVPALLLERLVLTPFWNMLLGFQSKPCTPVENLVLTEAEALTPFRNGKGIVRAVRDGRDVQFSAQLPPAQAHLTVRVGDRLTIEEVAKDGEHVKVSLE